MAAYLQSGRHPDSWYTTDMHIAIYHNLPSGGAKRALYELVMRLADNHHVDAYSLSSANHDFADVRPYVANHRVYAFTPSKFLPSPWGRLNQAIRLGDLYRLQLLSQTIAQDIEQGGYDLVFVHSCQYEKAPSLLNHIRTVPKVYYCQESLRHLYEPMPLRPYTQRGRVRAAVDLIDPLPALYHAQLQRWDRRNLRCANHVLVNSEHTRHEVKRIYGIETHVSYLGVDPAEFHTLPIARDDFVLSVGSLTPLKGFDFLISALSTIRASLRPRLVIASNFQNSDERAYLLALAKSSRVDLQLMGNVSDEQLVTLYNRARMTVYAPIREPFGLVALESMACGTPVVGVREGGMQETVVSGTTGLLTEREASQFGAAVQQLLEDPDLAARLGANGRAHVVQTWSWQQAAARVERHLINAGGLHQRFGARAAAQVGD